MTDWKEEAQKAWEDPGWKREAKQGRQAQNVDAHNSRAGSAEEHVIAALAQLEVLAYQKRRLQEAKALSIPVAALDKLVRQAQAKTEDKDAELAHWKVEAWESSIDTAE